MMMAPPLLRTVRRASNFMKHPQAVSLATWLTSPILGLSSLSPAWLHCHRKYSVHCVIPASSTSGQTWSLLVGFWLP